MSKNDERKKEKQALAEKAINKAKTEGEKVNPQVEERRDQRQPRDKA